MRADARRRSLIETQKIVEANLPGGKRAVSQNRREYTSNYFVRGKEGAFVEAQSEPIRYYARILVLGDRRPYTVEVRVYEEHRRSDGQFDQVNQDEGLARVIIRRIQKALYQRREDRNIIDDFRVF